MALEVKKMESVSRAGKEVRPSVVLAVIGGALMLAGGLLAFSMLGVWSQSAMYGWGSMMRGGGWGMMAPGGYIGWTVGTMASISLAAGAVSIFGGYMIHKKPESGHGWGVAVLIASIIGLFGMGGFIVGPILGIVGGILALTKR
jgi:hypothetical protein